jgi:hypothetical protein
MRDCNILAHGGDPPRAPHTAWQQGPGASGLARQRCGRTVLWRADVCLSPPPTACGHAAGCEAAMARASPLPLPLGLPCRWYVSTPSLLGRSSGCSPRAQGGHARQRVPWPPLSFWGRFLENGHDTHIVTLMHIPVAPAAEGLRPPEVSPSPAGSEPAPLALRQPARVRA